MTRIFDRHFVNHSWCQDLVAWRTSPDRGNFARARNISNDDRVSDARFRSLEQYAHLRITADDLTLLDALTSYRGRHSTLLPPDFADTSSNTPNVVDAFPASEQLLWLLDLNGLNSAGILDKIKDRTGRKNSSLDDAGVFFETELGRIRRDFRPTPQQRQFLEVVLQTLSDFPYSPKWVTKLSKFKPYLRNGPNRWLEVLGVGKTVPGRLIVAVAYRLPEEIRLFRPTYIDSIDNPYHYPTPVAASVDEGGRAMDIGTPVVRSAVQVVGSAGLAAAPVSPLPEYIHQHVDFGQMQPKVVCIGRTTAAVGCDESDDSDPLREFRKLRGRHNQLLQQAFPAQQAKIQRWLD